MIFECGRRTENRHNPVTGELIHGAAVPLHHQRRTLDQLRHDLAKSLRTYRVGDIHRPHHIGEHDRDLLVLGKFGGRRHRRTASVAKPSALAQSQTTCSA